MRVYIRNRTIIGKIMSTDEENREIIKFAKYLLFKRGLP